MPSPHALFGFILAVSMNSIAQIAFSDLQARGASLYVLKCQIGTAALAAALFSVFGGIGINGLLYAWLAKSTVELCLAVLGELKCSTLVARSSA